MLRMHAYLLFLVVLCSAVGCANRTPAPTGFLSDYSNLRTVESGWMRFISPDLRDYSDFIVDPIQIRVQRDVLDPEKRAQVARYMRSALERVLRENEYRITSQAGVGTGRICVAITDIQDSKWYLNIHPATKITGLGKGGASMEAEVIDSVTGQQLAAVLRGGRGNQFELNPFSTIADVEAVIDEWAASASDRLRELRQTR